MLIADEMVANAGRHARTPLRVELRRTGERVVLDVTDSSRDEPRLIVSQRRALRAPRHLPGRRHRDSMGHRWIDGGRVVWAEVKIQ